LTPLHRIPAARHAQYRLIGGGAPYRRSADGLSIHLDGHPTVTSHRYDDSRSEYPPRPGGGAGGGPPGIPTPARSILLNKLIMSSGRKIGPGTASANIPEVRRQSGNRAETCETPNVRRPTPDARRSALGARHLTSGFQLPSPDSPSKALALGRLPINHARGFVTPDRSSWSLGGTRGCETGTGGGGGRDGPTCGAPLWIPVAG
jgi:hypothetical protein